MDSPDLLSKILSIVSSFNLRNPSALKSNFYSTYYSFTPLLDHALRTINNVNNIDMFQNTLCSNLN